MILFLHGPDTYRSRQRLHALTKAFRAKYDPDGRGVVQLDGESLTVEEFRKAVTTAGLFSARRLITVDSLLGRNKKTTVADGVLEALKAKSVPDEYVVIFWESELSKKASKLQSFLEKGKAEAFPALTGAELRRWITKELQQRGGSIDGPALERLASAVGPDLWRLSNEISKLIAYAGDRSISASDVDLLVDLPVDSRMFAFTDALGSRNARAALRELRHLRLDGFHPLALIQIMARQLSLLHRVQAVAQDSKHPATIAKRLKLHPFVAQKSLAQAEKFSEAELLERLEKLLELDGKLKSSRLEPDALLEGFVLDVTR
jgi:DNA polymerase-3 subunit delta